MTKATGTHSAPNPPVKPRFTDTLNTVALAAFATVMLALLAVCLAAGGGK